MGLAHNELGANERAAIADAHIGSVWFTTTSTVGQSGVKAVADSVQAMATSQNTGGVGFFVAANQEGGRVQALRGEGFSTISSAVTQGTLSIAELEADARRWGDELAAARVNLDFAPVADVVADEDRATNEPIGLLDREFGTDPDTAGSHAAAFVRGLTAAGVGTTAKHFPGLGRVVDNTDFTANVVDKLTTADDRTLGSFAAAIDADVPFVMVALAMYKRIDPDRLAVFSPIVIGDLLRRQLGFGGVVMSDDLGGAEAVADIPIGDRVIDFLSAGGDFVVVNMPTKAVAMAAAVRARAQDEPEFAEIVDQAVSRVLEAKEIAGLLPC